mgnify:CR=1 FL=1
MMNICLKKQWAPKIYIIFDGPMGIFLESRPWNIFNSVFKGCLGQEVSDFYSHIKFGIYRGFYLWCEIFNIFSLAIAEILQHTDA